jgi:transposase-like protein
MALYNTELACKKLGVSQATLYRWLSEAAKEGHGDKLKPQSGVDGRERLYSLTQLKWLAGRHGRELRSDEKVFAEMPAKEVDLLHREVKQTQQKLDERDREMAQLKQDMGEMRSFFEYQLRLAFAELDQVRAQMGIALPVPSIETTLVEAPEEVRQPRYLGMRTAYHLPSRLPKGSVPLAVFAEKHRTARDLLKEAIRRKDLQAERLANTPGPPQYFFTPAQQDAAVAYLKRKQLPVRRCSSCPHEAEAESEG